MEPTTAPEIEVLDHWRLGTARPVAVCKECGNISICSCLYYVPGTGYHVQWECSQCPHVNPLGGRLVVIEEGDARMAVPLPPPEPPPLTVGMFDADDIKPATGPFDLKTYNHLRKRAAVLEVRVKK